MDFAAMAATCLCTGLGPGLAPGACAIRFGSAPLGSARGTLMNNLGWWLFVVVAVMFSMSG
jgi:hypothetical protein